MIKSETGDFEMWNKVFAYDMPFVAFDNDPNGVVDDFIDAVARMESQHRSARFRSGQQTFYQSPWLIAIDLSSDGGISDDSLLYLQSFHRIHPFVVVNANPHCDEAKERISQWATKEKQIIPFFSRLPAIRLESIAERYGQHFVDLLLARPSGGFKDSISFSDPSLTREIQREFGAFTLGTDSTLRMTSPVRWLGASEGMSRLLNELYMSDEKDFNIAEMCVRFAVEEHAITDLIEECYFFRRTSDDRFTLRLRHHLIYEPLVEAFARDFVNSLVAKRAARSTTGRYSPEQQVVYEYHSVGRLFETDGAQQQKLLSRVYAFFSDLGCETILIVDNGNEDALFAALSGEATQDFNLDLNPSKRLLNYFDEPVLYPFSSILPNERIGLLIDVVNKGRFLRKTIDFLEESCRAEVVGAYAWIVAPDTSADFSHKVIRPENNPISLAWFTVAPLRDMKKIRRESTEHRLLSRRADAFGQFWSSAPYILRTEKSLGERLRRVQTQQDTFEMTSVSAEFFQLKELDGPRFEASSLYPFLRQLHAKFPFTLVLGLHVGSITALGDVIMRATGTDISTHSISEDNLTDPELLLNVRQQKRVLIVNIAASTGRSIVVTQQDLRKQVEQVDIRCLVLMARRNHSEEKHRFQRTDFTEIPTAESDFYAFYSSARPFYLFRQDDLGDRLAHAELSALLRIVD